MNYLPAKKNRRTRAARALAVAIILLVLAGLWFSLGGPLKRAAQAPARPLWRVGKGIGSVWSSFAAGWRAKSALESENRALQEEIAELELNLAGSAEISGENARLKEILGRLPAGRQGLGERELLLAAVLAKPNRSPYDTFVLDVGKADGVIAGQRVYAYGNALVGQIAEVFEKTSKAKLFSAPGEKTDVIVSAVPGQDLYLQATGRGGGGFEISAPRDLEISEGAELLLPGLERRVLAVVTKIISDPRDPVKTILAVSPVNIQHLRWAEVER